MSTRPLANQPESLAGIWRSHYEYTSSSRSGAFENEHYVVIQQRGNHVTIKNLPHTSESVIELKLEQDGQVLTGTWRECTSPSGYYKGKMYHGAIQLAINKKRTYIEGKWLGFGANLAINTGNWSFTRLAKTDAAKIQLQANKA